MSSHYLPINKREPKRVSKRSIVQGPAARWRAWRRHAKHARTRTCAANDSRDASAGVQARGRGTPATGRHCISDAIDADLSSLYPRDGNIGVVFQNTAWLLGLRVNKMCREGSQHQPPSLSTRDPVLIKYPLSQSLENIRRTLRNPGHGHFQNLIRAQIGAQIINTPFLSCQ